MGAIPSHSGPMGSAACELAAATVLHGERRACFGEWLGFQRALRRVQRDAGSNARVEPRLFACSGYATQPRPCGNLTHCVSVARTTRAGFTGTSAAGAMWFMGASQRMGHKPHNKKKSEQTGHATDCNPQTGECAVCRSKN